MAHRAKARPAVAPVTPTGCPGGLRSSGMPVCHQELWHGLCATRSSGMACMAPGAVSCPVCYQELWYDLLATNTRSAQLRCLDRSPLPCCICGCSSRAWLRCASSGKLCFTMWQKAKIPVHVHIRSAKEHVRREGCSGPMGGKGGSPNIAQDLTDLAVGLD